jgi:hypothetical protein
MKKTPSSSNLVLYVWLSAIYAILSLYIRNIDLFDASEVLVVFVSALFVISFLFFALYKLFGSYPQSGLISFLVVVLFFSYGHSYNVVTSMVDDGLLTQQVVCFPAAIALVVLLIYGAVKHPQFAAKLTFFLNFTTVILVCFPVAKVLDYFYYKASLEITPPTRIDLDYSQAEPLPDIYYLILDGYSREDWLATWFDFDNSEFIQALEARGFYVANRSCSNYGQTQLSIPSALSMEYLNLPDLGWLGRQREGVFLRYYSTKYNRVGDALIGEGYTYILFATRYKTTSFDPGADVVIDFKSSGPYITTDPKAQEGYLTALLPTTLFKPFFEYVRGIDNRDVPLAFTSPERVLMNFDTLKTIPARPEPTFTFAHIMKPHSPYDFDRYGNIVGSSTYTEQVLFANMRVLDVIDTLLADSPVRPIIIIQGDHAWHPTSNLDTWRFPILNAYLVPDETRSLLYPSITPVNSFRALFDSYFGTTLGLLDDVSYRSSYDAPFDVEPIESEFDQTWCQG